MNYKKYELCPVTKEECVKTCGFRSESTLYNGACVLVVCVSENMAIIDRREYAELVTANNNNEVFDEKYGHLVKALDLKENV